MTDENKELQEVRVQIIDGMGKIDLETYRKSVSHNYPAQGVAHALILSRRSPIGRKYNSLDELFEAYGIQKKDGRFYFSSERFNNEGILLEDPMTPLFNPDWTRNMSTSKSACSKAQFLKSIRYNMRDSQFIENEDIFYERLKELTNESRKWERSDFYLFNLLVPAGEVVKILYRHTTSKPLLDDRRKELDKRHIDLDKRMIRYYDLILSCCLGDSPPDYEGIKWGMIPERHFQ